jgi:S-DNA-T family DNA segregation ATPase FtsK/SpoIIIE
VDAPLPSGVPLKQQALWEEMKEIQEEEEGDPLFSEAVDLVRRQGRCSVSMLQRRLRIGYTRAARLVDVMEEKGIVSEPQGGTGVRDVLDYGQAAPPKED